MKDVKATLAELVGAGTVRTLPCDRCSTPVETQFHQVLCPPCYRIHREVLVTRSAVQAEHDDEIWRRWLNNEISEKAMLAAVHDQATHKQLAARVTALRDSRDNKSAKRTTKTDGAVFGEQKSKGAK